MKKWILISITIFCFENKIIAADLEPAKAKIQQNEMCFKYTTIKTTNGDVTITNSGTPNNPNIDVQIGTPVFKFNGSHLYHIDFDKLKDVDNVLALNQMRSKKDNLWYQFKTKDGPMASLGSKKVSQIAFVKGNGSNEIFNNQNILVYSHGSIKIKGKDGGNIVEPIEVNSLASTQQEIDSCKSKRLSGGSNRSSSKSRQGQVGKQTK